MEAGVTRRWGSLAACQDQCVATSSCQAFNFYRNGMCVMLSVRKPTR
ncbi:PAN domain-containing protein [Rhizobium sp. RHZ02]